MPTSSDSYNTRLTDETLERRFRETFRSQSGAELVDDLYASGVIVPVVDFTAAAEGSGLRSDLQQAWDIATGHTTQTNSSAAIITTPGFYKLDLNAVTRGFTSNASCTVTLGDGFTTKIIYELNNLNTGSTSDPIVASQDKFIVFVRSGDTVTVVSDSVAATIDVWYRQIADVYGNLQNPSGYVSQ